ncbi:hypothetical protein WJX72_000707 [[Myrmecia] bisecta]|uniref:ABC transporter domain-containing protein n=1 Tax=[Myrmecia] bisecta TaxID=41462 RepID=A0AAW1R483_9CHLO
MSAIAALVDLLVPGVGPDHVQVTATEVLRDLSWCGDNTTGSPNLMTAKAIGHAGGMKRLLALFKTNPIEVDTVTAAGDGGEKCHAEEGDSSAAPELPALDIDQVVSRLLARQGMVTRSSSPRPGGDAQLQDGTGSVAGDHEPDAGSGGQHHYGEHVDVAVMNRMFALAVTVGLLGAAWMVFKRLDNLPPFMDNTVRRLFHIMPALGTAKEQPLSKLIAWRTDVWFSTNPYSKVLALVYLTAALVLLGGMALYTVGDSTLHDAFWQAIEGVGIAWTFANGAEDATGATGFLMRCVAVLVSVGGMMVTALMLGIVSDSIGAKIEELKKGKSEVLENRHTLILGWSDKLLPIVDQICMANESEGGGPIVILADRAKEEMEDEVHRQNIDMKGSWIVCRSGNPLLGVALSNVTVSTARSIIVLATADTPEQSDARVLRTVMSLMAQHDHHVQLTGVGLQGCIVAEVSYLTNEEVVRMVGQNLVETVVSHDIIGRLLIQCARQPGLATVWDMLLGFEGDEFYIQGFPELVGRCFADVALSFTAAVPFGVRTTSLAGMDELLLNPPGDYVLQPGDELVVLAEDSDSYAPSPRPLHTDCGTLPEWDDEKAPEAVLICGWRHDMDDMVRVLNAFVEPGSELWLYNEIPIAEREEMLVKAGLQPCDTCNLKLVYKKEFLEGHIADRSKLEELDPSRFQSIIILADALASCNVSAGGDITDSDSQTLALLLLLREIQKKTTPLTPALRGQNKGSPKALERTKSRMWYDDMRSIVRNTTIISEILDSQTRQLLKDLNVGEFVLSNELVSRALAMVSQTPMVNHVITQLFQESGDEVFVHPAGRYVRSGEVLSFLDVMARARQREEIPIGYCEIDSDWARDYQGPASVYGQGTQLLYAPNGTAQQQLMTQLAMGLACPADPSKKSAMSSSFYAYFSNPKAPASCGAAALAFNLLLVYAFLPPTRSMVAAIVREKELRLREGMRILGLKDAAYWASWAITHFSTLALSGLLCALIGLYPFTHSDVWLMLAFFWLVAAALISFSYFLSTLFSTSRVAGMATAVIYVVSMVPGYLIPTFQPYGGPGWVLSCLLPPSSISLFAYVLVKLESSQRGVRWSTLPLAVTAEYPFSASTVFRMLALDVVLYAALTWYFDKVVSRQYGQTLPVYFFLQPSYWHAKMAQKPSEDAAAAIHTAGKDQEDLAVSVNGLRKTFGTTDGGVKAAVDGLDLDIYKGQITALLGVNGAGKTTTISILTGMIPPTSGTATVNGMSILTSMDTIRQDLGVCPQFDILWPEVSVVEHLQLYAAIKGYDAKDALATAVAAACDVGLEEKLQTAAGELSGGQRRKLSVAIAFLGSPAVVFLDEPTSGMDPYSRRFTWNVIKRNRDKHAIVLTTHSMEEADLLCDRIAIMVDGRLATVGTALDLKSRFGVGYTLTIAKTRAAGQHSAANSVRSAFSDDAASVKRNSSVQSVASQSGEDASIASLVESHVPSSTLVSRAGAELAFRLPKEDASSFAELLRELDERKAELGIQGYGLAVTTLEEVFLRVSAGMTSVEAVASAEEHAVDVGHPAPVDEPPTQPSSPLSHPDGQQPQDRRLQGLALYAQQFRALFVKRVLSAKRDRLALVTQLAVPILMVLVALWSGKASSSFPQEPALAISRQRCLTDESAAFGATPGVYANVSSASAFQTAFPAQRIVDTHQTKLWSGPFFAPPNGTMDGYLLDHWYTGQPSYDAVFMQQLDQPSAAIFTLLVNQTAIHGLPAALNSASSALLRMITGRPDAGISVVNHPLPTLKNELAVQVSQSSGDLLLVLCMTIASAVLSASFVVFLVRERESRSKHVQVISGAPATAFWGSTYLWDYLNFSIPAAGIIICFYCFDLPQFRGERMGAVVLLLWTFGLAALPLTYLAHFLFEDEMKALQRTNTACFLIGYLGFLTTFILDSIYTYLHKEAVRRPDEIVKKVFRAVSPHFNVARGLYEISLTYKEAQGRPNASPFTWAAAGQFYAWLLLQALAYSAATLLVESGWLSQGWYAGRDALKRFTRKGRRQQDGHEYDSLAGQEGGERGGAAGPGQPAEDADVKEERLALTQDHGPDPPSFQVLLGGLEKSYRQGPGSAPLRAVDGLWLGIAEGECFGLLGVNGAGKTTTFRMLTGELVSDEGDAFVCGRSVRHQLAAARQLMGYCPQFNALPGALTGREVLRMYARLRGVPADSVEDMIQLLLQRLDLGQYADRVCETYSGGNKRKLSVAVALVGDPPVVLMDEPSTGMDPGARRFLWGIIQKQVIERGHTVILTSHSMEECEALCTRIGIMTAGRLRCLGTVQHLKNRFGAGYLLEMRLKGPELAADAVAFVQQHCPAAELTQQAGFRLSFTIPQHGFDLPALFGVIEGSRTVLGLDEYSISQTTLERVFVALARDQQQQQQQAEQ